MWWKPNERNFFAASITSSAASLRFEITFCTSSNIMTRLQREWSPAGLETETKLYFRDRQSYLTSPLTNPARRPPLSAPNLLAQEADRRQQMWSNGVRRWPTGLHRCSQWRRQHPLAGANAYSMSVGTDANSKTSRCTLTQPNEPESAHELPKTAPHARRTPTQQIISG